MLLAHALFELTRGGQPANEETWQPACERALHRVRDEMRAACSALRAAWIAQGRAGA